MAKKGKPGRTLGLGPPEGQSWVWMTNTMLGSITFRALSVHARRTLDFLLYQHAADGGQENGALAAPHRQLAYWGLTEADIARSFKELELTGYVRCTFKGLRQAGGGDPSRYRLTWIPSKPVDPSKVGRLGFDPPTHDWLEVIRWLSDHRIGTATKTKKWGDVAAVRRWIRDETGRRKKPKVTPQMRGASPLKCAASA